MLTIAIQNKGRLYNDSVKLLERVGITFDQTDRELMIRSTNRKCNILFLRDDDIPQCVSEGFADFGIVGENVAYEDGVSLTILKKLGFGQCKLVIAVPEKSCIDNISMLDSERIATSYPRILKQYLASQNIEASIIKLSGSVEVAPALGIADAVCDLTQTGSTLKENKLRTLATILKSEAVLITNISKKVSTVNSPYNRFIDMLGVKNPNYQKLLIKKS